MKVTVRRGFLGLLLALVARKVLIALVVMKYVREHAEEVSLPHIVSSPLFSSTVEWMKNNTATGRENFVFMLNRHVLNMTSNWLCSTRSLPDVHSSSLFVTMDEESRQFLEEVWPSVHVLPLDIISLQAPFNYGDGPYQLFYLLRATLSLSFVQEGATFWMSQQDTYWRTSLASVDLSPFVDDDIVFDRASDAAVTFIAGGYYRARPTKGARRFFQKLALDLSWWYSPDNAYMSAMCRRGSARCGYLPFETIPNWKWLYDRPSVSSFTQLPPLLQFDGETKLGGKLATMKSLGFFFLDDSDMRQCKDSSSPSSLPSPVRPFRLSLAHLQFCVYQFLVDLLYSFPPSALLLDYFILPCAHFFMLSM